MRGDLLHVCATILRHPFLYRQKVRPVVVDGLDGTASGVVCPESVWREFLSPGCQCTTVASANEDPRLENQVSKGWALTMPSLAPVSIHTEFPALLWPVLSKGSSAFRAKLVRSFTAFSSVWDCSAVTLRIGNGDDSPQYRSRVHIRGILRITMALSAPVR
jgi:hypothetical protein